VLNGKVEDIKHYIERLNTKDQYRLIPELLADDRAGVRRIGKTLQGRLKKEAAELERINRMREIEKDLKKKGYRLVAGIDEAGRGPLAGPVVAAAVILPEDFFLAGVDDSKKLSPQRREALYQSIIEKAAAYGVGMVDSSEIDRINILQATYRAVDIALDDLSQKPDCLLLDAITLPGCSFYQQSVVKGDQKCLSIAAASIIAKVTRDRFMEGLHRRYPMYNFLHNKGYGTREHVEAILKYGPCPYHRRTFIQNIRRR
jgi:ribonuclease HII